MPNFIYEKLNLNNSSLDISQEDLEDLLYTNIIVERDLDETEYLFLKSLEGK